MADVAVFFKTPDPALHAFLTIGFFEGGDDFIHRNIRIASKEFDIFHESAILGIVGLKDRVLTAIEFERRHSVAFAQFAVEGRCRFDPLAFQKKLREGMEDKKVRSHELQQLARGQMIPDVGKTGAGWDSARSPRSAKQRGFWNAETAPDLQYVARAVMSRKIERVIRIIADSVAHRIIKAHGLVQRFSGIADRLCSKSPYVRMIAIDDIRPLNVLRQIFHQIHSL